MSKVLVFWSSMVRSSVRIVRIPCKSSAFGQRTIVRWPPIKRTITALGSRRFRILDTRLAIAGVGIVRSDADAQPTSAVFVGAS